MEHWKEYIAGLTAYCQSGDAIDVEHASKAIKLAMDFDLDTTECLTDFVGAALEGHRYSDQLLDEFFEGFNTLIAAGGKFPIERLFSARYATEETLEAEVVDYHIRGRIIDWAAFPCTSDFADWKNIDAAYWGDVAFGNKGDDNGTEINRLRYLKYCSTYLQSM